MLSNINSLFKSKNNSNRVAGKSKARVSTFLLSAIALSLVAVPASVAEEAKAESSKPVDAKAQAMEAISKPSRPIRDKWAVVIGIDSFKDPRIPKLRFSSKDAKDFAKFLVEKGEFSKDHVIVLLNENATRNNIYSALGDTWLPKHVLSDDLVLIYASTHGSPKELDVGGDNFLIAYDTMQDELFSTGIRLQNLAPTVKQRTQCDRLVFILDACNSGSAEAGGKGLYRATNFDLGSLAGEGQIIISSSDANQRSWESKRYDNGVFTRNLMNTLEEQKATTLDQAFDKLKDGVQQEVRFDRKAFQTPVMRSKWEGDPLIITAKPVAPRTVPNDDNNPYRYDRYQNNTSRTITTTATSVTKDVTPQAVQPVNTVPVVQTQVQQPIVQVQQPVVQQQQTPSSYPARPPGPAYDMPAYGSGMVRPNAAPTGKEADLWMKFQNRR